MDTFKNALSAPDPDAPRRAYALHSVSEADGFLNSVWEKVREAVAVLLIGVAVVVGADALFDGSAFAADGERMSSVVNDPALSVERFRIDRY
jgi:hypothetical protein